MKSAKGHRNRKNPRSAELYREENRKQNAARPKQELVTTIIHGENGEPDVVKYTRVRD